MITKRCAKRIFHPILTWTAAKHLGQVLSTTPAFFMTTPATTRLDFDQRLAGIKLPDDSPDNIHFLIHF